MRGKHVRIELEEENQKQLEKFVKTGTHSVKLINRAKIILALNEANGQKPLTQAEIAAKVGVTRVTINNTKKAFLSASTLPDFLQRKKRKTPPVPPKITGDVEAHVVALACSKAPEGHARWGLKLLADKCVELHYIDSISYQSIQRI